MVANKIILTRNGKYAIIAGMAPVRIFRLGWTLHPVMDTTFGIPVWLRYNKVQIYVPKHYWLLENECL
jgi:hypothetical protein